MLLTLGKKYKTNRILARAGAVRAALAASGPRIRPASLDAIKVIIPIVQENSLFTGQIAFN